MSMVLTFAIFFPLVGAVLIATLPRDQEHQAKYVAALASAIVLAAVVYMFLAYDRDKSGYQFVTSKTWLDSGVSTFKLHYAVGVDGLSLPLIALNAFLTLVSVLISFKVELRPKEYFAWLLILETSLMGVFSSLDFVLFFLFWEVELVPMYFLISIWGSGNRVYSAWKYVLYTFFGSAFMIIGILTLGFTAGTFDIRELGTLGDIHGAIIPAWTIFGLISIAFLIKLPVVPFHTWLPDAHTDAPTAVSVILAGVLLKMGGYGILRLSFNIMPNVAKDVSVYIAILAAVSIIYGALMTLLQKDLKRLIAYSSVSHMGYVLLGASSVGVIGLTGAATQLVTHGLITGMLFVLVGMVYDRAHTRDIGELSGLAQPDAVHHRDDGRRRAGLARLAGAGRVRGGGHDLPRHVRQARDSDARRRHRRGVRGGLHSLDDPARLLGRADPKWAELPDATAWWERAPLLAMGLAILAIGVYPAWMMDLLRDGVTPIAQRLS